MARRVYAHIISLFPSKASAKGQELPNFRQKTLKNNLLSRKKSKKILLFFPPVNINLLQIILPKSTLPILGMAILLFLQLQQGFHIPLSFSSSSPVSLIHCIIYEEYVVQKEPLVLDIPRYT